MHLLTPTPRGMALVMAMIVIVLMTLLVAGAISFTGTERAASEVQTQEDTMSSCVQAARNLFISKLVMLDKDSPAKISFDEDLRGVQLRTGHFTGLTGASAEDVSGAMKDPNKGVNNINQTDGVPLQPKFYRVTAVCRETEDSTSPEREIEFMVRVGL
jgi:type II secretory pathway component PulK